MKKNVGTTDKIVRIILAIVFGALYLTGTVSGTLGIVLLVLGVILLATSFISFCPLYALFRLNSARKK